MSTVPIVAVPTNWREDEATVGGLFAPFRPRAANPVGYDSKMAFWREQLLDNCRKWRRVRLSKKQLETEFRVGPRLPCCLEEVLTHLKRSGDVLSVEELRRQCAAAEMSWSAWGMDLLVWRPLRASWNWALQLVTSPPQQEFVSVAALQELSSALYREHTQHISNQLTDSVMRADQLFQEHAALFETRRDFDLALLELRRTGQLAADTVDEQLIVKFRLEGETQRPVITDTDRGIMRLAETELSLRDQIQELEKDSEVCRQQAREYVKKKLKMPARECLRKRKKLQELLEKRYNTLNSVQNMLHKIGESQSNQKVLEALSAGLSALQTSRGDALTLDNVDETMANIQDELETHADIDAAMSRPVAFSDISAEPEELEAELDRLMAADSAQKGTVGPATPSSRQLPDLPTPPSDFPEAKRKVNSDPVPAR